MIKDATIVMILGMGTVFLVLLALLGLMTLGGRLAARYARPLPAAPAPGPVSSTAPDAGPAERDPQTRVAVAVAAARRHGAQPERGVSK
jgi:sodium pump decarboxylase gamma subunit